MDKALIRQRFAKATDSYDRQAGMQKHVAQHMAEEPDVKQWVFQRGTVNAEQMGGRPAAGVLAQEQHPQ